MGDDHGGALPGSQRADGDAGAAIVEPVQEVDGGVIDCRTGGSGEEQGRWVAKTEPAVSQRQAEGKEGAGVPEAEGLVEEVQMWDGDKEAAEVEAGGEEKVEVRGSDGAVRDEAILRRSEAGSAPGRDTPLQTLGEFS